MMRTAKWIFWIWAAIIVFLQIVNLIKNGAGVEKQNLVIISELLIFAWFGLVYLFRRPLSKIIKIIPNQYLRFVIIGYLSTVVAELVYIFSAPIHRMVGWDLTLTAPFYLLWMILWFPIIRKYNYTLIEAFILAGLHGFIIEGLLNSPLLSLLAPPLFIALYGSFFIVPYLLMKNDFTDQQPASLGKKIKMSFVPLLAFIVGLIWIAILVKTFNLTLH